MIHPTSVTNIVDRLEAQGLVRRVPHPTDRRTTLAEITAEGRKVCAEATDVVTAVDLGIAGLTEPRRRPPDPHPHQDAQGERRLHLSPDTALCGRSSRHERHQRP